MTMILTFSNYNTSLYFNLHCCDAVCVLLCVCVYVFSVGLKEYSDSGEYVLIRVSKIV